MKAEVAILNSYASINMSNQDLKLFTLSSKQENNSQGANSKPGILLQLFAVASLARQTVDGKAVVLPELREPSVKHGFDAWACSQNF